MAKPTRSELAGATFNLLNTILGGGGGIVPLPRCVRLAGLRLAPLMLGACAVSSAVSACAIIAAAGNVRESTYQGVARRTIGPCGAIMVQSLIVSLTFGISVAVINIFADVAPSLLRLSRTATVVLAGCTVTPIVALVRRIERLSVISIGAAVLVAAFVCFVCVHHTSGLGDAALDPLPPPDATAVFSMAGMLEAVSVVNLSFLCHFNLLPLFRSLPGAPAPAVRRAMYGVIAVSTALALVVYGTVGILGALAFGARTSGNVFADYATRGGHVSRTLNNAIATAQLLSLPLLVHEGVRELVTLLRQARGGAASAEQHTLLMRRSGRANDVDGGSAQLLSLLGEENAVGDAHGERLCSVLWCAAATLIAIYVPDTSKVLALVAALCGAPLMSVLPLLMLLRSGHGMAARSIVLTVALLMLGLAVSIASAFNAVAG